MDFLEAQDRDGITLLMLSSELGHTPLVRELLSCHVTLRASQSDEGNRIRRTLGFMEKKSHGEYSAITFAAKSGRKEVVSLLVKKHEYYWMRIAKPEEAANRNQAFLVALREGPQNTVFHDIAEQINDGNATQLQEVWEFLVREARDPEIQISRKNFAGKSAVDLIQEKLDLSWEEQTEYRNTLQSMICQIEY